MLTLSNANLKIRVGAVRDWCKRGAVARLQCPALHTDLLVVTSRDAHKYAEGGHVRGKVVIKVSA